MAGGFGSGKSEAATMRLVHLITQDPGIDVSHFFPSYRLAKRRGFQGAQKYLASVGFRYMVNKSDLTIYLPDFGSTMYLESYHDPDAIVSFEIGHAVVDELDTLPADNAERVWQKISERCRQPCNHPAGNTVSCVTTPDQGTSGFCFRTWGRGERIDEGYHYIKAGTATNPFLPPGYADQIAKNYDPVMAQAFLHGDWVSFTRNKVYHFFDKSKHHSDRELVADDKHIHVGLDFNVGGTCASIWVIDAGKPIAVDEFVSHDTRDFCIRMESYKAEGRVITVYPDATGKAASTNARESDLEIIKSDGFRVDAPNKNPPIRDRINTVNGLLSHDKVAVNTNKCPRLTDALESQGYDKNGDPEKFKDHPSIDDWTDGAGYFLDRKFSPRRPVLFTGIGSAQ